MGGRGREYNHRDKWDWIGELSDDRLERYGKMSSYKVESDIGKESLNYWCSQEFERRNGFKPEWSK